MISARCARQLSGEGHHVRLLLAPARQHRRPLAGATQGIDLVAAFDNAAVDEAGDDRRELTGARGDHRLVEHAQALLDPAELRDRSPFDVQRDRGEVGVGEALRDLDRRAGRRARRLVVAGLLLVEHGRDEQIALLRARGAVRIDETLGATEPAHRGPELAAEQQDHRRPEGAAGCAQPVAFLEIEVVRALEGGQEVPLAAEHEGGRGRELGVGGAERSPSVGRGQRLERVAPGALSRGRTASLELVPGHRHGLGI